MLTIWNLIKNLKHKIIDYLPITNNNFNLSEIQNLKNSWKEFLKTILQNGWHELTLFPFFSFLLNGGIIDITLLFGVQHNDSVLHDHYSKSG